RRRYAGPLAAALAGTVLGLAAPASATHDFRLTSTPEQGSGVVPLAGRTIVIDPGHQLGNHNYPGMIDRLVPAGGFKKPCNTTGTATNGGYPEATFTWKVSRLLKRRVERLGAEGPLPRHSQRGDQGGSHGVVRRGDR